MSAAESYRLFGHHVAHVDHVQAHDNAVGSTMDTQHVFIVYLPARRVDRMGQADNCSRVLVRTLYIADPAT